MSDTQGRFHFPAVTIALLAWQGLALSFNVAAEPRSLDQTLESNFQCDNTQKPNRPHALKLYVTGNPRNACIELEPGQGGVLLMGGGSDLDRAFRKRVFPRVKGGDVVVLRSSGGSGYNLYLKALLQADSVETLVVGRRRHANTDYVNWVVRNAEFLWMAGGDQSDYLNQWQGTRLQDSIHFVYQKGGVIGGTSAGSVVQSEFIYDPDGVRGATSPEALSDLCHRSNNVSTPFLSTELLRNVIVDSHFMQRDRMGRLLAFMAGMKSSVVGLGVDEETSIFFTANGDGIVDGENAVYVLKSDDSTSRTQVACHKPVRFEQVLKVRLTEGQSYNIKSHVSTVPPTRMGVDGSVPGFYLEAPYTIMDE